ncbi:MAG: alcohol dehydrogenase catalytic domain-containing protein [Planctomycetes bacterium]|nr:alcohol dehydrogenase catalytic domain-containing protein [Planctomycetota bacterium]
MKALVKYAAGDGNVEIREVPQPACGENQVLLEVEACGICGTDLHVYHDTFRNFPPVILGHEFAGRIVDMGKCVAGVALGDRCCVLGATAVTCGRCTYCRQGEFMFCRERRGMGHGVNGAFTRQVAVRPDQLYHLPDNLPTELGALVEPLAAAVHAVCEISVVRPGDVALVSGPGPMGMLCFLLLAAQGIPSIVVGTSADAARLALARRLGAVATIDVTREDLSRVVRAHTGGQGIDLALECAGAAASARSCLDSLRPLGRYTQVGHFGKTVELNFDHVAFKQLQVRGSVGYTADTWSRTLRILQHGRLPIAEIVTHRLPLERWREGFDLCERKEALKVLLLPAA